jgi:AraC-like DNA-binding protein
MYAGPSLNLAPHSGSVWCFAVGVDGSLAVTTPDGTTHHGDSVLIPPRLKHQLVCRGSGLVSCYLEPTSTRADACRDRMSACNGEISTAHTAERLLARIPTNDETASAWLDLAAPARHRAVDGRIAAAAQRLRDDPATTVSSREIASAAGLSESRFLHLFRDELGTSLRRYRIWVRLVHAGTAIGAGANLTEAAMKSGFASPSHLADRFKSTFGLSASRLLASGLTVRTP